MTEHAAAQLLAQLDASDLRSRKLEALCRNWTDVINDRLKKECLAGATELHVTEPEARLLMTEHALRCGEDVEIDLEHGVDFKYMGRPVHVKEER